MDSSDLPGLTVQRTDPGFAMQSRLMGTLDIDAATNCVVLRTPVGYGDTVLIDIAWPVGWSVAIRAGKPALLDATGATAAYLGDEVAIGGGSVDADRADAVRCTGQDSVFIASGLSRL
jgi:hypothetical protein